MKDYLLKLWDDLRTSFWFVPLLLFLSALIMGFVFPRCDAMLVDLGYTPPGWIHTTTAAARATLSALAGAMITVTGTVFSITIVTLSLASQQFGSRLLRRFMYDFTTQITLGVLLATAFYALMVLRVVEDTEKFHLVPHLSVGIAMLFAVISFATLVWFIHNVALNIQAPRIVAAVSSDLEDAIERIFPEKIGTAPSAEPKVPAVEELIENSSHRFLIPSHQEGYLQGISGDILLSVAESNDLLIILNVTPGDFIDRDSALAVFYVIKSSETESQEQQDKIQQEIIQQLNGAFLIGTRRTPRQDVNCAVNELVEVAVRSLSPGINDPFTAINCVDYLGANLGRLAERKMPSRYRFNSAETLRIVAFPISFQEVLEIAFDPIREHARNSTQVLLRLTDALESISHHLSGNKRLTPRTITGATENEIAQLLIHHLQEIRFVADASHDSAGTNKIRNRVDELLRQLETTFPSTTIG